MEYVADNGRGTSGRGKEDDGEAGRPRYTAERVPWAWEIMPEPTEKEMEELERSIRRDGCLNPVITWGGQIIDGHKRAEICIRLGLPYQKREIAFESREHAEAWSIRQQVSRRNLDVVGRCELAERLEKLLQGAAKERQRKAGREHGRGMAEKVPSEPDASYDGEEAPGPYGGILDDVIDLLGESRTKAANLVGLGRDRYLKYKEMKKRPDLIDKMRGPAPQLSVSAAHKIYKVDKAAADRRESNRLRVEEAKVGVGGNKTALSGAWGPDGPVWCEGKFQLKRNLALLPDGAVRLILCDPPYGEDYDRRDPNRPAIEGDKDEKQAAELLAEMLELLRPKLAKDAHVVFFCGVKQEPRMREVLDASGYLKRRSHIVWVKARQGAPGDKYEGFAPWHERALHGTQGAPGFTAGLRPHDAYQVTPETSEDHLTPKPVALLRQIIEATTVEGEWVADPFGGTASTLIAALECGRRAWGSEKETQHYRTGFTRIDDLVNGKKGSDPKAKLMRRKPPAPQRPRPNRMGFAAATAAPEPEPSLEDKIVGAPGAITWGWGEPS